MGYLAVNNSPVELVGGGKAKALDEFNVGNAEVHGKAIPGSLRRRSQAILYLLRAAQRFNESGSAVRRATKAKHTEAARPPQPSNPTDAAIPVTITNAKAVAKQLGSTSDSRKFAAGALLFGILAFICGAAPWALPGLFLLFVLIAFPLRAWSFLRLKYGFFLIDFCYCANAITFVHLAWFPEASLLGHLTYALADGPLAGALVVWQCAWVFSSGDHAISVLVHLLPGLALHAHRRFVTPQGWRQWLSAASGALLGTPGASGGHAAYGAIKESTTLAGLPQKALWLFCAPLLYYLAWQLLYFVVVQVLCRRFILENDYDTSYNCLARRAAKSNNIWNRIVRRGSIARRCSMYGLVQLVFTVICLVLFIPVYHYQSLATAWQVVKFVVPVYYGAVHQCQRAPQHTFMRGIQQLKVQEEMSSNNAAARAPPPPAAAPATIRRNRKSSA